MIFLRALILTRDSGREVRLLCSTFRVSSFIREPRVSGNSAVHAYVCVCLREIVNDNVYQLNNR